MVKKVLFHLPWIGWLAVIMLLSFVPGDQLPQFKIDWISIDTLAHFTMYFVLSVFFLMGFIPQEKKKKKKLNLSDLRLYGLLILVGILIGYFVELIQGNLIHLRYFDIKDIVANSFGTIFGAIIYSWIGRKLI